MSNQYPQNFNSAGGGHRGQFNPQQQQQQIVNINQMGGGGGMQNSPMPGGQGGPMVTMGGYAQNAMMQQQQANVMQGVAGVPGGMAGVGMMNPVGMQSPSHAQQQITSQQQQQLLQHQQMQQMQQQQQMMGGGNVNVGGQQMGIPVGAPNPLMQQQQQQLMTPNSGQHQHQLGAVLTNPSGMQPQQPSTSGNMLAISQPNPHKEINIVALSRLGQETVQDITSRFQEIFTALKIIQPTANRDNNTEKKVQEYFRTIRLLFKRVRIIYEKCNDGYPQGMEYTHVESLIPYKDEPDHRSEPTQCEEYRKALQENQELIETVKLKNRQLREIIDRTRIIIWEINTMLSMRRS